MLYLSALIILIDIVVALVSVVQFIILKAAKKNTGSFSRRFAGCAAVFVVFLVLGVAFSGGSDTRDSGPVPSVSGVEDAAPVSADSPAPIPEEPTEDEEPEEPTESSEPEETAEDEEPENPNETESQRRARRSAAHYLEFTSFSRDGLIKQLEFESFSEEDATYGADNCGANWSEQALKQAKSYLEHMPYSHDGLVKQLEFEKYTTEQAVYGADNCGADWNEQAANAAKSYLEHMEYSRDGLIRQLEFSGFTHEQAAYGADASGL